MVDIPITQNFDNNGGVPMIGYARFDDDSLKRIHDMIAAGEQIQFAVGFVGEPNEDGTYEKVELVELSMIVNNKE